MKKSDRILQIRTYLDELIKAKENPQLANNIQISTLSKQEFKKKLNSTEYYYFVAYADYHYFVARSIFYSGVTYYGFYCAQQCIELYFKAFLRFKNQNVKTEHSLPKLWNKCLGLKLSPKEKEILNDQYFEIITERFDPFNQYARYPVSKTIVNTPHSFVCGAGGDMDPLDYFVYQMRKIISIPVGCNDMLNGGKWFTNMVEICNPDLWKNFKAHNINFMADE